MSALPEPRDLTPAPGRGKALVLGGGGLLGAMMVAPLNDRNSRCLPSPNGGCDHVAEQGLVATLAQAIKISHMILSATTFQLHRLTHPEVRVEVIQPDRLEPDLDSPMDFRGRDRVLARGKSDGIRLASRLSAGRGAIGSGYRTRRCRMHRRAGQRVPLSARFLIAAVLAAPVAASGAFPALASPSRIQVRQEAPDFALNSPDGSVHKLSDLRGRKNLVLIFFRGTW